MLKKNAAKNVEFTESRPSVTMMLPGAKAQKILEKRSTNVSAAVKRNYMVVIDHDNGAMKNGNQKTGAMAAVKTQANPFANDMVTVTAKANSRSVSKRRNQLVPQKEAVMIENVAHSNFLRVKARHLKMDGALLIKDRPNTVSNTERIA